MHLRELASQIAKREGLKKSVSVGNVREVLRIICEIELETDGEVTEAIQEAVAYKESESFGLTEEPTDDEIGTDG